jgi:glucose-6-phosphate dehydrogenase assembly protein OpcA
MATQSAPLVSLQAPKDVSIGQIEAELSQIWQMYNDANEDGSHSGAMRAATFTLVVYEPEETQQLLALLGFYRGPIDGILGPQTEVAIQAAQKAYRLKVDGKPSAELLEKLREKAASQSAMNGSPVSQYSAGGQATIADAIASQNPCRIISLFPTAGSDKGVSAQVSAYCPIQKRSQSMLICCEYITLKGTEEALERVSGMIPSLLISDLPKFLWWKATPDPSQELFRKIGSISNTVIVDSSRFQKPETELLMLQSLMEDGINIADLNWSRLAAWQELAAEAFDPPERRAALKEVDQVTIDFEKGNSSQALMYLGWLASRLQWQPVSYKREQGDYDIHQIQFITNDQLTVNAELAGVPVADSGSVAGDLVGLRLTSSNPNADCCTILCSETTGCMRMEAGGSAQACRIQQVTSLADQQAEVLLSQQLQRWGRDMLFEESLEVTAQMLKLLDK